MTIPYALRFAPIALAAAVATSSVPAAAPKAPLAIDTARVSIAGTSNIHEYTASTTTVRVTRVALAAAATGDDLWSGVVKPGAIEAFEIAIPATSLSSPKAGLDKNMWKALKTDQFDTITFALKRLEPGAAPNALKAIGTLRIAGVEREVTLNLLTERRDATLAVKGSVALLMTDYGIKPPVAMLGMLKTDPKVTVSFETVLAVPQT
jgi:polyisoprenoid-binding protein YceI